jgi:hypothetical protein
METVDLIAGRRAKTVIAMQELGPVITSGGIPVEAVERPFFFHWPGGCRY